MKKDHRQQTIDNRFQTKDNLFKSCVLCLVSCVLCFTFDCYAQSVAVSSTELINNAKNYDGSSVVYAGEAIGDVMIRGDNAWINVNDGENAIGIWLDKASAQKISFTGSFHGKGDRLEVTGAFQRSCPAHGGDLDIHASEIRIISPGRAVVEKLDTTRRNIVYTLMGVLLCILIFVRHRKSP